MGPWAITYDGTWDSGLSGEREFDDPDELGSVLEFRDDEGAAEFTLTIAGERYPHLVLSVQDERWYVHFFPDEGDPGAYVENPDGDDEEYVAFPAGAGVEVTDSAVVDRATSIQVAEEFLMSGRRPRTVDWVEL